MNLRDMITDGTVVKFRDGRLAVAFRDIDPIDDHYRYVFYGLSEVSPNCISKCGIIILDAYDDNLNTELSKYDIMAVTKDYFSLKDFMRIIFGFVSEDNISWDWEREEVKEVTMSEVEEKFGCKVKIVKEEKQNEDSRHV